MNIDLIYKNNSFNFDLRKDISVKYLEDLASKLISKDKSSFDLLYNNNNLSECNNLLLKDLTQNEATIPIVISPKMNQRNTKVHKTLPKIKLTKHIKKSSYDNNDNNAKNNILILNNNDNETNHSLNDKSTKNILKYNMSLSTKKKKEKEKKNGIKNEVFEDIYDKKENELFILMKNLSQKIKEYDDILYQKYKSDSKNRELLLFEKNIIDFKNRQLQYIKKLISYFKEKFDLNEFFWELKNYNIKDGFRRNKKSEQSKLHSITQANETETINKNNELPLITCNENKPIKMLYLSQNKRDQNNRKEIEKELINNKPILNSEKHLNKKMFERNMNDNIYQNIETQDKNIYKTVDEEKPKKNKSYFKNRSIGTTKDNTNQSESSTFSKMQEKQNYKLNLNNPKNANNENENVINKNKNMSDNNENEINKENIGNIIKEKSKKKINLNNDIDNKNNINSNINNYNINKDDFDGDKINSNNSPSIHKRRLSIESVSYNNKKLSCLMEDIKESSNIDSSLAGSNIESNSNNSNSYSNSNSKEKSKAHKSTKTFKSLGAKKKKRMNYSHIKNSKIGYMLKSKQRKVNQRVKKLGNNEYDFLI